MNRFFKPLEGARLLTMLWLLAGLWLLTPAAAFGEEAPPLVLPELTEEGFLPGIGEFIYEAEEGPWIYISQDLNIRVDRYQTEKPKLVWYETIIRTGGRQTLRTLMTNPERPGSKFQNPLVIARENQAVLAFNDDFFGYRIYNKDKVGIVIREGKVYGDQTNRNVTSHIPNLDLMAVFKDGSMRAFYCNEYTAQEYLQMGVTDTFCFGPVVLKDGEIGQQIQNGKYKTLEPRTCLGMAAPGHYVLITVEGRRKTSKGTGLLWVAQRMQEMGVTQAINLDGGQTVALVFRGRLINKIGTYQNTKRLRTVSSMIAVGETQMPAELE